MTFLEAPESIEQMEEYCRRVGGAKLANMLEQGSTPVLPPQELKKMGYTMAAYPLTLLSASIKAMNASLERIQKGIPTDDIISTCKLILTREYSVRFRSMSNLSVSPFAIVVETKDAVGFTKYSEEEQRYKTS
jgi:2-methylisocitrate lyase-like PEP mutase family enzyme